MNIKMLPERIRFAAEQLKCRRGIRNSHGTYLSPERAVLLVMFYSFTTPLTAKELWLKAKQERFSVSYQTTCRFLETMVEAGLAYQDSGKPQSRYGDAEQAETT